MLELAEPYRGDACSGRGVCMGGMSIDLERLWFILVETTDYTIIVVSGKRHL